MRDVYSVSAKISEYNAESVAVQGIQASGLHPAPFRVLVLLGRSQDSRAASLCASTDQINLLNTDSYSNTSILRLTQDSFCMDIDSHPTTTMTRGALIVWVEVEW